MERETWFYRGLNFLKRVILFLFIISVLPLFAEERMIVPSARDFLKMELEKSFPLIESLSKEQTKELITSLRHEVKAEYPKIDHFYFLISHLEELSAIEKEQARLRSLLWVFGLALFLFSGFLGFLLLRQRQAIRDINDMTES